MKLIIDIPEETYEIIKNINYFYNMSRITERIEKQEIVLAIKNGTPLPKGHGRLIDENELLKMTECYKSELGRLKADPFVKCGIETVESFIKEMPTIIEADKGETE